MAMFENAHSGTTPAPLRQNGVAGVKTPYSPLRHSGAGGDSGTSPASLRQSAVEVDSGRRRSGGKKSANQLDKLRLELYDLVGVLDEWAPRQRRLQNISDQFSERFLAAHQCCADLIDQIGSPPYTNASHSAAFRQAYQARFEASLASYPHRKAVQEATRYIKEVKKRMAEIKAVLGDG